MIHFGRSSNNLSSADLWKNHLLTQNIENSKKESLVEKELIIMDSNTYENS